MADYAIPAKGRFTKIFKIPVSCVFASENGLKLFRDSDRVYTGSGAHSVS